MSRKVVPDKGSLNREGPVTKAFHFPPCTRILFHLNWNGECEKECIERHDDRYGGRAPSKKGKTNVAIVKIILSLTVSQ